MAVGVDNIFVLVESYQNSEKREQESLTDHLGRATGEVIPSMFMSTAAQVSIYLINNEKMIVLLYAVINFDILKISIH